MRFKEDLNQNEKRKFSVDIKKTKIYNHKY